MLREGLLQRAMLGPRAGEFKLLKDQPQALHLPKFILASRKMIGKTSYL